MVGLGMSIEWRNKMAVGEAMIDGDHKRLIEFINKYETAVGTKDIELLKSTFSDMLSYTESHFSREENLMRAIHYGGYRAHKTAHEDLVIKLKIFHARVGDKTRRISLPEVTEFLHDWLVNHILNEDMKIKPLLEGASHRQADMSWQ
jgi:hemerythrin